MADLNNMALIGRLTRDAELKTLSTGTKMLQFAIANNTGYGQYAKCNFFDVKMWGKGAEGIAPYMKKGQQIGVAGTLENETWLGNDGQNRSKWVLTTNNVTLLGGKKDGMDVTTPVNMGEPNSDADFKAKYARTEVRYEPLPKAGFAEDADIVPQDIPY
jgi:single-strand DNA-binding protein